MRFNITTLCIIIASIIKAQNLTSGSFYYCDFNNGRENVSCYIEFFNDNRYILSLDYQVTPDFIKALILSSGRYEIKGKMILFCDEIHGFTLRYTKFDSNQLKQEHGFHFLKNKIMTLNSNNAQSVFPPIPFNATIQKRQREEYLQQYYFLLPFTPGFYESEYNTVNERRHNIFETGLDYEINIQQNGKYVLYYKKTAISEGSWKRRKNEIILFDESLQHQYYILINAKGLISKYLLGEFKGCKLFLKK
jgi:hypothetical protein